MSLYKQYSPRQFRRILRNNGFTYIRSNGDHDIYENGSGKHISIPATRTNKMLCRRLIKENGLVVDI